MYTANGSFQETADQLPVFPQISARGAYKIKKLCCLFYHLSCTISDISEKEKNIEVYSKTEDIG